MLLQKALDPLTTFFVETHHVRKFPCPTSTPQFRIPFSRYVNACMAGLPVLQMQRLTRSCTRHVELHSVDGHMVAGNNEMRHVFPAHDSTVSSSKSVFR